MTSIRVTALMVLCLLLAGCGGKGDLPRVTGKVTLDGQPLEGAVVEFEPLTKKGSASAGLTDSKGRYELMFTFDMSGAVPGEHRVTIRTAEIFYEDDECCDGKREPIPAKYNSRSQLRRTVELGRNRFNFDL